MKSNPLLAAYGFILLAGMSLAQNVLAQIAPAANGPVQNAPATLSQDEPLSLVWSSAFWPLSSELPDNHLLLIVITNDNPFADAGRSWCANQIDQSARALFAQRRDLRDQVSLQSMAAGLPAELTGGKPSDVPAQAVVAICDAQYRLFSLLVGVPTTEDLLQMVEDAESVRTTWKLSAGDMQKVQSALTQRSRERVNRRWRDVIVKLAETNGGVIESEPAAMRPQIRSLYEAIEPTFLADVRTRFGLTDDGAEQRLAVLQQHPQTRRSWCELIIPFIAAKDFQATWRPLLEMMWGHPPITDEADNAIQPLINWLNLQDSPVVLGIEPPLAKSLLPWPPQVDQPAKRRKAIGWADVQTLALTHPYRTVDAPQLAALIRANQLQPIHLYQSSLGRYACYQSQQKQLMVVREADLPTRFAAILKRSK